jgi:hypothetical protein
MGLYTARRVDGLYLPSFVRDYLSFFLSYGLMELLREAAKRSHEVSNAACMAELRQCEIALWLDILKDETWG